MIFFFFCWKIVCVFQMLRRLEKIVFIIWKMMGKATKGLCFLKWWDSETCKWNRQLFSYFLFFFFSPISFSNRMVSWMTLYQFSRLKVSVAFSTFSVTQSKCLSNSALPCYHCLSCLCLAASLPPAPAFLFPLWLPSLTFPIPEECYCLTQLLLSCQFLCPQIYGGFI